MGIFICYSPIVYARCFASSLGGAVMNHDYKAALEAVKPEHPMSFFIDQMGPQFASEIRSALELAAKTQDGWVLVPRAQEVRIDCHELEIRINQRGWDKIIESSPKPKDDK